VQKKKKLQKVRESIVCGKEERAGKGLGPREKENKEKA